VPDPSDPNYTRRLPSFTEKVAVKLNSLIGQGILQPTDPTSTQWTLRTGGFTANRAPGPNDDTLIGATLGVSWVNTATGDVYFCWTNDPGKAVWRGPF
jgi:hypothetical protein